MSIRSSLVWAALLTSACVRAPVEAHRPPPPCVAPVTGVEALAGDERAVAAVLQDFHEAAAAADEERYFSHLTEDSVFLGTDASERWSKPAFRAYAHPHFAEGKAWSFRAVRRSISFAPGGATAWFEEELTTAKLGPARGSGVSRLLEGRWQIAQYNLTLTIPNERFASVKDVLEARQVPANAADPLAELGWLAGAWTVERPDGERSEEIWSQPAGGSMVGSGRSTKADKTTLFEFLRIEARGKDVVYLAQPFGKAATAFRRIGSEPGRAVFENLAHDWPKRVSYARTARGIDVRVEGAPGARVEAWTYEPAVLLRSR